MIPRRGEHNRSEAHLVQKPFSSTKSRGHALIAEALRHCGVKRVIGITGTPADQIVSECAARGIRPIGTRHQHAAVLMAATSNYIAGRLESVVAVSAGPLATNALTGVLVARDRASARPRSRFGVRTPGGYQRSRGPYAPHPGNW